MCGRERERERTYRLKRRQTNKPHAQNGKKGKKGECAKRKEITLLGEKKGERIRKPEKENMEARENERDRHKK